MLQEKFFRLQLSLLKPITSSCSLEATREGQDKLGKLLESMHKDSVIFQDCRLGQADGTLITPRDELTGGVVLYLHGGGYTCGDLQYARGFGTTLAAKCGIRVLCTAYRLAPEAPFPSAVEDGLAAYRYLLARGYSPQEIVFCGESAGGGLIYALCLKLRQAGYDLPAGLIGISPWTDLTLSGNSFEENKNADPSLTKELLKFYADCYVYGLAEGMPAAAEDAEAKRQPMVSPLFGDLSGFPPSLLFAGGDEILLDDTRRLVQLLQHSGCRVQAFIRKGMWHAYVLYCLKENEEDFDRISRFLRETISRQKKLRWMRLDNAAKIYPAVKTRRWNNFFRLSVTMAEDVDRAALQAALDVTVRRFPSIAVRLRRGLFWYYLEEIPKAPELSPEGPYPMMRTPFDDIRKCAFRVILYERRISAEFFHAITDANGGMVFLKTLVAEYLFQKHGLHIPIGDGILDRLETPRAEELEDSFIKNSGPVTAGRRETNAFHLSGTPEQDGFCTNTTFCMDAAAVAAAAKKFGVSVTAFLAAVMIQATIELQKRTVKPRRYRRVKVLLPVDLRRLFPSRTLRNFVLYVTPEADMRLGEYSFEELCRLIRNQMGLEITPKEMQKRITANVRAEQSALLKIAPLFLKNLVMKLVFSFVGETKSCFSLSNLGIISLPEAMQRFVVRMDFVLGVQAHAPYNVGVLSVNGRMYLNFIRNIREPLLEREAFRVLKSIGISVLAESNQRD